MIEYHERSTKDLTIHASQIFDQLNDAIFIVDHRGIIIELNHSACELIGYERSDIIGLPIGSLIIGHHSLVDGPPAFVHSSTQSPQKPKHYTTELVTKNLIRIPIEISHVHLTKDQGELTYVIIKNLSQEKTADILRETSSTLSSSLDQNEVFDRLLVELRKLIPYDGGNVMFITDKSAVVTRINGYEEIDPEFTTFIKSLHFEIETTPNLQTVIREHEPLIIPNISKYPNWKTTHVTHLLKSWVGVPIIIDNEVVALFSLDKSVEGFFTNEHVRILRIFANQAASAIKNARQFEAETLRIQQLDSLQSTLVAINSRLQLKPLLKEIVNKALQLLHAPIGELALYDPDRDIFSIVVSHKPKNVQVGLLAELETARSGLRSKYKKTIKIDRLSSTSNAPARQLSGKVGSQLIVPLMAGKDLLGVLGIGECESDRVFQESDVALLNNFAHQATIAIKNSRLFEKAQRRAEEAETIQKASAVVIARLDQTEAVQEILEQLAVVIPYDSATVLLENNDCLQIVGCKGFKKEQDIFGYKLPLNKPNPLTKVFLEQHPIIYRDIPVEYPQFVSQAKVLKDIHSWLGAPLVFQDRTIGIITLHSKKVNLYQAKDVQLLTTFAGQVAVALENARMYTDAARSAERFKVLYQLSQAISANIRSEEIYPAIHKAVSELMPVDFFGISLFDSKSQMINDVYRVERGKKLPLTSRPVDKGLTANVIRKGKSLLFERFDSTTADTFGSIMFANVSDSELPQSVLIVPLILGSNRIGTMSVHHYASKIYTDSDREMLELLAATVAIAVENARLFNEVQQLAITDPLTRLFNRRKFEELSTNEFERSYRYKHPLCILMIDLDQFKQVNDTFGHIVGDQVISGLASLCRNGLRSNDLLARYGGEEFIILLPETTAEKAMNTAERLREECVQTEFSTNQGNISISISVGVAEISPDCASVETLIDRADQALYVSKHKGRNTCTLWTKELSEVTPIDPHKLSR